MFGKKKGVVTPKTYIDGVEQTEDKILDYPGREELMEVPGNIPELDIPNLQEQEVPPGFGVVNLPPGVDCVICYDFCFYADNVGVWHHCPRCNAKDLIMASSNSPTTEPSSMSSKSKGAKK